MNNQNYALIYNYLRVGLQKKANKKTDPIKYAYLALLSDYFAGKIGKREVVVVANEFLAKLPYFSSNLVSEDPELFEALEYGTSLESGKNFTTGMSEDQKIKLSEEKIKGYLLKIILNE